MLRVRQVVAWGVVGFVLIACNLFIGRDVQVIQDPASVTQSLEIFIPSTPTDATAQTPSQTPVNSPQASPGDNDPFSPGMENGREYAIGEPVLTELYVAVDGDDANTGLMPETPLRTLTAAWSMIPAGEVLAETGYRINLMPGVYPCEPEEPDNCQNYVAERLGTARFPIILQAYEGSGTVTLRGGYDFNHMAYLYLIDLNLVGGMPLPTNASGNNLLHLTDVDHVLLRGLTLSGPDCANDSCNNLQEVLKVNQAQHLYVENNIIYGAWHSTVDYFVVQYGHFIKNQVHTAGQWCMYVKGGTSYLMVDGNEFHDCQLGFQAGQSANLPVMRSPWLHYESYDIKFVNNVLHDLPGVGLSVAGGYNILFAYNTLYRVGYSADPGYPLLQAVIGERGCNPTDEIPDPLPVCRALTSQGGWGPDFLTDNLPAIPNRNVFFYNNLIYNPNPAQTLYSHFGFYAPTDRQDGLQNLPPSLDSDTNLVVAGNLIWNGPLDHPLGIADDTGCTQENPTCNPAQLVRDNLINQMEPQLMNPSGGDYRPVPGGNLNSIQALALPDFTWDDAPGMPPVPVGTLSNRVYEDCTGQSRSASDPPGAYTLP